MVQIMTTPHDEQGAPSAEAPWVRRFMASAKMDLIESMEDYKPGGYHPVLLDEMLVDRFEVVHKLGYGGIGTIWLCMDHQNKE